MANQIGDTIQRQIGHGAFVMMGAKNLAYGSDGRSLHWKVGRNPKRVTHVVVKLEGDDTYTVTFKRCTLKVNENLDESCGVYVEQLHEAIEAGTGLAPDSR